MLAFRIEVPILEIALDIGYEGPEAFARAFRKRLGQSPRAFRTAPDWTALAKACRKAHRTRTFVMTRTHEAEIRIETRAAVRVLSLEHRGDPAQLGESLRRFIALRREHGLPPRTHATYNVFSTDPEAVAPEDFRMELCVATDRDAPAGSGLVARILPGGRCAVRRHVGDEAGFARAVDDLMRRWLPQSGEATRGEPPFCRRIATFPDVPEHEAVTEILLPLADRASAAHPPAAAGGAGGLRATRRW